MGIHANNRDARLMRIYCDGVTYHKTGPGLITDNPYDQTTQTQEFDAWAQGWNDSNDGNADLSVCGYPLAGKPEPESLSIRY